MYKIQNIVLGAVIVGLIVVGSWVKAPKEVTYDQIINAINNAGSKLGALSNPDLISNWFSFGRVREWAYSSPMLSSGTASTTACSFLSPAATSSIIMASANVASTSLAGLSATTSLDIGYSQGLSSPGTSSTTANPNATTTILARATLIGLSSYLLNATTTIANSGPTITDNIVWPHSYINVKVGANASTSNFISGTCKIKFRELI